MFSKAQTRYDGNKNDFPLNPDKQFTLLYKKTDALVLHSVKYGEQKLITHLFTRELGHVAVTVHLSQSSRGRLKKQYFQPLTLLSIETDYREQLELQKLKDVVLLTPWTSLLTVPDKLAIGLFVAEFLYHTLRSEQQNRPLFDYVRSSLEWLDGSTEHYANFHLVFLMRTARFLGIRPATAHNPQHDGVGTGGSYFDLRSATFCAEAPAHRDYLMPQEADRISILMRMDYATMHLFRLSRAERNRILDVLLTYYRLHVPQFPELRSVAVLQELFV